MIQEELFKLIPQVDLSTEEKIRKFKNWQNDDGSVEGLKELLNEQEKSESY